MLAAVIGLLLAGNAAALAISPSSGPDHPDKWDPRVAELVTFVQEKRHLTFEHPVAVEFLDAKAYSADCLRWYAVGRGDRPGRRGRERAARRVGLAPKVDLAASAGELMDGGTLVYYDSIENRVTVRGTELSTALRVTLVHELTHVLQDQNFDLERTFETDGQSGVPRTRRG